jgi:hypothetical protein
MAVIAITLQPSADIHLVLQPANQTLQLDVLSHDDTLPAPPPTSVRANCAFTVANAAVATVSATGLLTPLALGRTFLSVVHTPATGTPTSIVARIWVHTKIDEWWIGNNRASVHEGEADLLLTAYAKFDDTNEGDISGHGFAAFSAPAGANATVDTGGRVTGVTPGNATIRGTLIGVDHDVVVTVVPSRSTLRPIVEPVRVSGPMDQRRNVLFLAEGFTDRAAFATLVQKVVDRLVSNKVHEPYHILRDDMNYWLAFEPSQENGITPGPRVNINGLMFLPDPLITPPHFTFSEFVATVGLPDNELAGLERTAVDARLQADFPTTFQPARLENAVFDAWQLWENTGILQARDSQYGLMYGTRPGDRSFTADPKQADNSWYLDPIPGSTLLPDRRRSTPNLAGWFHGFYQWLGSLRTKKGASDPDHVIGPRWARDADDQGLVFFLCNDEVYGAFSHGFNYAAAAIDLKNSFTNTTFAGRVFDHDPNTSGALIEALVATVAHELGHHFFLGDEYEGDASRTTVVQAEVPDIEINDNLTTAFVLTAGATGPFNPGLLKWDRLLRIDRASRLAGPATNGPGANILVPLAAGEGRRWTPGENVFVRTRNINVVTNANTLFNRYPPYRRHAVAQRGAQVEAVTGDVVTVSGGHLGASEAFPAGSTLFVGRPNKARTAFLTAVLPGVRTFMQGPPAGPVIGKAAGQCAFPATFLLTLPPPIPGIVLTADDRPRVIGLYEGAARFNCGAFRPAPVCKMRNHMWLPALSAPPRTQRLHFRFCFVCRYSIVNEVNPRRHPELNALYPGREA